MHRREDTLILKGIPTDCGKKPWFEVFTDFCVVNITTAADFKSVPWYHWIQSWEDVPALVHHLWVTIWAGSIILRKWFLRDDHFSLKVLWEQWQDLRTLYFPSSIHYLFIILCAIVQGLTKSQTWLGNNNNNIHYLALHIENSKLILKWIKWTSNKMKLRSELFGMNSNF